jgi:transposase
MCLKVYAPWSMPADTEAVGKVLLEENSAYRLIGEKLFGRFHEQDFVDFYSVEGKPGISPVILAFVTVFQFMEKLPDRQAAESLRMRMDWKYAMHLPLSYDTNFDHECANEGGHSFTLAPARKCRCSCKFVDGSFCEMHCML